VHSYITETLPFVCVIRLASRKSVQPHLQGARVTTGRTVFDFCWSVSSDNTLSVAISDGRELRVSQFGKTHIVRR